ncbi:MAG TPA: hypothetical protein VFQ53_07795 [Kofleriaceae bacterium]|nr:hypothetical protein [Kofleriaceae bacterium]
MAFGIDARARSRKAKSGLRSLLGRAPDAKEVGERLGWLARRVLKRAVIDISARRVTFALHPAAPPARIAVLGDGDLEIRATTSGVGPAYHRAILDKLAPLLDELDYVLVEPQPADPAQAMLGWLAGELRAGATRIGMPGDRSFKLDAAVQTAMGPRDAAWRDAVIADPERGRDAFAWWEASPGHEARSRALLAMWLEVPWREPLDTAERELMERVDDDLREARRADKTLELPYNEWTDILNYLEIYEDRADKIRARCNDDPRTIGYRRHPMDVELAGGWSLELGGNFVTHWEDDERWWATDGDRVVEVTSFTAPGETDSAKLLAVAGEVHPVIERLLDPGRVGRAEAYDDGSVHIVIGLVAAAPHVAILTCKGSRADEPWALATWRTLRHTQT